MTWLVGMPQSALRGNLDRLYVEHLLKLVRESSLTHAVILAQDYVYDDRDQRRPDLGAFYVPNDYVLGANIAGFERVAAAMQALGVI